MIQYNQEKERRIINVCQTCRKPIYEGEPIYTSSKGQSSGHTKGIYGGKSFLGDYQAGAYGGHYSGTHSSEMWAQCSWCYDQWMVEVNANKKFLMRWWIGGILLAIIATVLTIFIWPGEGWITSFTEGIPWYRWNIWPWGSLKIPLLAPIVFLAIITLTWISSALLAPAVDRYKLRKKPIEL